MLTYDNHPCSGPMKVQFSTFFVRSPEFSKETLIVSLRLTFGMSTPGIFNSRFKTSCQFIPSKNGCSFNSSESRLAPNLFLGSRLRSFLIKSFALADMFLGIFNGPLHSRIFTFWCSQIRSISWSYSKEASRPSINTREVPANTNQLCASGLALREFMVLSKQQNHKNFLWCYYRFPLWKDQNQWVCNVLSYQLLRCLA